MVSITVIASSSKGNCYLVTDGKTSLLLECGVSWKRIQAGTNFKTSSLAGVLLTHSHADHSFAVKDVIRAGIDIYMSAGTADAKGAKGHCVHHVRSGQAWKVGTWTILAFDVVHDAAEPLGFLLANGAGGKLLFLTDTAFCKYRFTGLTHLMIECNFSAEILERNVQSGRVDGSRRKRLVESHFSIERVVDFLHANDTSKLQEIWLCHLSDENSNAEKFQTEIQKLTGIPVYIA